MSEKQHYSPITRRREPCTGKICRYGGDNTVVKDADGNEFQVLHSLPGETDAEFDKRIEQYEAQAAEQRGENVFGTVSKAATAPQPTAPSVDFVDPSEYSDRDREKQRRYQDQYMAEDDDIYEIRKKSDGSWSRMRYSKRADLDHQIQRQEQSYAVASQEYARIKENFEPEVHMIKKYCKITNVKKHTMMDSYKRRQHLNVKLQQVQHDTPNVLRVEHEPLQKVLKSVNGGMKDSRKQNLS